MKANSDKHLSLNPEPLYHVKPACLFLFFVLIIPALTSSSTASEANSSNHPFIKLTPQVERILTRAATFYGGLQSFEVDIDSFSSSITHKTKRDSESTFHLALKQPNLFSMILETGTDGQTEVSDGKSLITYQPYNNIYSSSGAPTSLEDIVTSLNLGFIASGDPLGYEPFLPKNFIELFEDRLVKCGYIGSEEVSNLPAEHIRLTKDSEDETDYWIAKGSRPLLLKTKYYLDAAKFMRGMSDNLVKRIDIDQRSEKRTRTTIYSNWRVNEPVPEAPFQFQIPATAKEKIGAFPYLVHPLVGQVAPDFQLGDLDGKPVKLSNFRGKIVVLDFWMIRCPPCIAGLPILTKATSCRQAQGVVFYGINTNDAAAAICTFQKNNGLSFHVLLDADHKVAKLYRTEGNPVTFVIDREGNVQLVDLGYNIERETKLSNEIDTLLSGRSLLPDATQGKKVVNP